MSTPPDSEPDSPDTSSTGSFKASPGRPSNRRRRLREYRCQGLAHPDALQANLSATNADLMEVANGLGKVIRSALRGSANPLKDCPDLLKVLQTYHNCARLVQRFTLFDERFRAPSPKQSDAATAGDSAEQPEVSDGEKLADTSFPEVSPRVVANNPDEIVT
jgi:hypothetical protein